MLVNNGNEGNVNEMYEEDFFEEECIDEESHEEEMDDYTDELDDEEDVEEDMEVEEDDGDNESDINKFIEGLRRKAGLINPGFTPSIDDSDDGNYVDENDYHNKGTEYARKGKYKDAIDICSKGLRRFPDNIDLLADIIKYSADTGNEDIARIHLEQLNKIPRKLWNWRAYTFSLEYLKRNPIDNEQECRDIISDYKKYIPTEEKSAVAESELEEKLGNYERCKEILKATIKEKYNAPQCALRLLDIQLESGEFEEALETSNYFAIASCEVQSSTNQNYQLYVRCLIEDALLHKKYLKEGSVLQEEVDRLKGLYEKLLRIPECALRFSLNINNRVIMLDFLKTTAA